MKQGISLRQIEAFRAVIEQGTVSLAADVLCVSQPAISKLIANLEADAGMVLFSRKQGRLAPTATGMKLYECVERIFSGLGQISDAIKQIKREEERTLTIGFMPALAGIHLAEIISGFNKSNPDVMLTIIARSSHFIKGWLMSGRVDVALLAEPVDHPQFISEAILQSPKVCVIPNGHPLAQQASIRPEDLHGVDFIEYTDDSPTVRYSRDIFLSLGIEPNYRGFGTTAAIVAEMVAAGMGLGLMHPLSACKRNGSDYRIRPFLHDDTVAYHLCYAADSSNASIIQAFRQSVKKWAGAAAVELKSISQ